MLVVIYTVASCYYNCCTDGSTSPGNYGYFLVWSFSLWIFSTHLSLHLDWIGLAQDRTGGELLWNRYWTFGFHKMLGNYRVASRLVAFRIVLCSIELVTCQFFCLRSRHSPQHPVVKHPESMFLPKCQRQVSLPYRTTGKIIVWILLLTKIKFILLNSRRSLSSVHAVYSDIWPHVSCAEMETPCITQAQKVRLE
jgi:hypothetical protein